MHKYERIIYWSDADDKFIVEVPELAGCMADGNSIEEAIKNTDVIIQEWIEIAEEKGQERQENMLENITINKQSSIKIVGSKVIYFDPFGVESGSRDADVIFITHDHYDHFEPESINMVAKEGTKIVAPESMRNQVLAKSGINVSNCVFAEPMKNFDLDGLEIETVPAYNELKPFHDYDKKWLGYVVTMDGMRYYVSGDTDDTKEVRNVKCDVALVPIGGTYTMDKKQAARCIAAMKPKTVIPTHYGSIVGSMEDGEDFKTLLKELTPDIQVELKL